MRVHQILAADVPFTDGILQAVRVVAPEGSIVNARPPAPIAAAHMHVGLMAMELGETCLKQAIACSLGGGLVAERVTAPGGTTGLGLSSWHGTASFLVMDGNAVGAGGAWDRDGIDMTGSNYGGPGLVYPDVETVEQAYPVRYLCKRLRRDAGGAGRFRGGASVDAAFTVHGEATRLEGTTLGMRRAIPLAGLFGGYPGACTRFELEHAGTVRPLGLNTGDIPLGAGDVFRFANASGSGLGDPLEREPERVLADVREGYVSAEAARTVYGVVLAGDVDAAATRAARDEIRAARRARALPPATRVADPPRAARAVGRLSAVVEVVRDGPVLVARCAACGAGLAHAPGSWKAGTAVAETILGTPVYSAVSGATAPPRATAPVVLCECFCPGCSRLLETDVVLAGAPPAAGAAPAFWAGDA